MRRLVLALCVVLTALASFPSVMLLPRTLPLFQKNIRVAAGASIEELRKNYGWWMVDATMLNIEEQNNKTCFSWEYHYRSRRGTADPVSAITCN